MQNKYKKTALILLIDPPVVKLCQNTVESMGHRCLLTKSHKEALKILSKENVDLLICTVRNKDETFSFFDKLVAKARARQPFCRSIAILDQSLEEFFPILLKRCYPRNLIADNHPPDLRQIKSTIEKLLSNNIFGMDKYGIVPHEILELRSSHEKYDMIQKAREFYLDMGISERIVRNVELIIDELLMNAIFDAPISKNGKLLYSKRDRSAAFDLKPKERPTFAYGINQERLAVSISDSFGTFKQKTFFSCVNRCFLKKSIKRDTGRGAGLGLFLTYQSLNQMVINVADRRRTEFIALIDCYASARNMKRKGKSFHYFNLGREGMRFIL